MKYRFKHVVEYGALRFVAGLFRILPHRAGLCVAWCLALLAFHVIRWRVAEAQARIREVFGDRFTDAEVRGIAWRSMRNFFFSMVELIRVSPSNYQWVKGLYEIENPEYCFGMEKGRGGIIACPHLGNWELAGVAAGLHDLQMFMITGQQRNPLFNEYIGKQRSKTGIEGIPRNDPMLFRSVVKKLKDGSFMAFTNDLRSKTPGVPVQFLGKPANLVQGMAVFARTAKVPIIPAINYRVSWNRHYVKFFPPIYADTTLDREEDAIQLTQKVMDIFDAAIRERPDQYFWFNKRWVLDPYVPES